jgi:hypothetical protein
MEGLTQAISTGALSVVVRPLGWSATHPISIPRRNSGVAPPGFLGLVSFRFWTLCVALHWDNHLPVLYEALWFRHWDNDLPVL